MAGNYVLCDSKTDQEKAALSSVSSGRKQKTRITPPSMKLCLAAFLIAILFQLTRGSALSFPRCKPCPEEGCTPPEGCFYGVVKDRCQREMCAKGPGERCGGRWELLGACGEGMFCSCGRCAGCSLKTFECFTNECFRRKWSHQPTN